MEKVDIVGGGISGLALAARLDPAKFEVVIHEQRPELPTVGTTLAMWADARNALGELGLLGALEERGSRLTSGALRGPSGVPLLSLQGEGLMGISRANLLQLLDSAVPSSVKRVARRVEEISPKDALVVGADGVHSAVRRRIWGPRFQAKPTPFLAVRGIIPGNPEPEEVGEYWGRGTLFGLAPAGTATNWYASFRANLGPERVDVEEALELTRRFFYSHSRAVRQILAQAVPEASLAQRIWTMPPLGRYTRKGIALLGDAAHAMTPNLGRGACEALVDAVTLGKLLNEYPREEALAKYNRKRVLPTQQLKAASYVMGRIALAETMQPARDALLRQVGKRLSANPAAAGTRE